MSEHHWVEEAGLVSSTTSRTEVSLGSTQSLCPSAHVAPGSTYLRNRLENKYSSFEPLGTYMDFRFV